jgi:hypothetical protein
MIERGYVNEDERKRIIQDFFSTAERAGITNINEWMTLAEYRKKIV